MRGGRCASRAPTSPDSSTRSIITGPDLDHSGTDARTREWCRVRSARNPRSVFPDYVEPDWMATPDRRRTPATHRAVSARDVVPVVLFTPHSLSDTESAPLVVAHDGTDFVDRGSC